VTEDVDPICVQTVEQLREEVVGLVQGHGGGFVVGPTSGEVREDRPDVPAADADEHQLWPA
jgi:hypothetical protein